MTAGAKVAETGGHGPVEAGRRTKSDESDGSITINSHCDELWMVLGPPENLSLSGPQQGKAYLAWDKMPP